MCRRQGGRGTSRAVRPITASYRRARGPVDTSVFIADESGRTVDGTALADEVAVSIVTIGELRAGVLVAADLTTRDRRLRTLMAAMALDPVPVDDLVAERWAHLRAMLRDGGLRTGVNASWIAATAMALEIPPSPRTTASHPSTGWRSSASDRPQATAAGRPAGRRTGAVAPAAV